MGAIVDRCGNCDVIKTFWLLARLTGFIRWFLSLRRHKGGGMGDKTESGSGEVKISLYECMDAGSTAMERYGRDYVIFSLFSVCVAYNMGVISTWTAL